MPFGQDSPTPPHSFCPSPGILVLSTYQRGGGWARCPHPPPTLFLAGFAGFPPEKPVPILELGSMRFSLGKESWNLAAARTPGSPLGMGVGCPGEWGGVPRLPGSPWDGDGGGGGSDTWIPQEGGGLDPWGMGTPGHPHGFFPHPSSQYQGGFKLDFHGTTGRARGRLLPPLLGLFAL